MRQRRGIALLAVLMATMALTVILSSFLQLTRTQAFDARDRQNRATIRGLLESGVAQAQNDLSMNPSDPTPRPKETVPGLPGSFAIRYDGPQDADWSVNNLAGEGLVDGPRGKKTVPAGMADVVVVASLGGKVERAEVLIGFGTDTLPFGVAASNRIVLLGDIDVGTQLHRGPSGNLVGSKIKAGLHSNFAEDSTAISWRSVKSNDKIHVDGLVSAVSGYEKAIDLDNAPKVETQTGAATRKLPGLDITAKLSEGAGGKDPAPLITSDDTDLPKDKYLSHGNLTVNGDLNLQNCTLYVTGDLIVNGALSGNATVYVNGTTRFQGDQNIRQNDNKEGLAVCSNGSVTIEGFDGAAFLNGDPTLKDKWTKAKDLLAEVDAIGESWKTNGKSTEAEKARMREISKLLTVATPDPDPPTNPPSGGYLGELHTRIRKLETSKAKGKVLKKIDAINSLFEDWSNPSQVMDGFLNGGSTRGILFAIASLSDDFDHQDSDGRHSTVNLLPTSQRFISRLKLNAASGRSVYKGIVYTNGSVYARNDITITGAIWANAGKDQTSREEETEIKGQNVTLDPGDVVLRNGVDITYSQPMAEAFIRNQPAKDRATTVQAWIKL